MSIFRRCAFLGFGLTVAGLAAFAPLPHAVRAAQSCDPDVICVTPTPTAALTASVNLQIQDRSGELLRDATVEIAGKKAVSDYNGIASLYNVPPGPQAVTITHRGRITRLNLNLAASNVPQLMTVVAQSESFEGPVWVGFATLVVLAIIIVALYGRIRTALRARPGRRRLRVLAGLSLAIFIAVFTALVSTLL